MKRETIKTIAIVILSILAILVVGVLTYNSIYADGYTKGYEAGGSYVVNFQTSSLLSGVPRIMLFGENKTVLQLTPQQYFDYINSQASKK